MNDNNEMMNVTDNKEEQNLPQNEEQMPAESSLAAFPGDDNLVTNDPSIGSSFPEPPIQPVVPEEPETERPIWSFAAQVAADKAKAHKRGVRGALIYAIIVTCLFAVCFAILALLLITGYGKDGEEPILNNNNNNGTNNSNNSSINNNTVFIPSDDADLADLVDSVKNAVVTVYVTTDAGSGFGSGFVYTDDGYIITNYHVIDGAKKIVVMCPDGRQLEAKLIDGDELSDVAVILVNNLGIPKLAIGNSDTLRVGESVIAIGTPVDTEYAGTVTKGIISGVKRKVRVYEEEGYLNKTMEMIQTDTTLNHGNSGGPLINMRGEVIGINTMKYYAYDAGDTLYFSIPINDAAAIADDIIANGKYSGNKGSATQGVQLGISCIAVVKGVPLKIDEYTEINPEASGVFVSMVNEGYPSYGKLRVNDIIVSFNGVETLTVDEMRAELFKCKVGDKVVLGVYRNGEIIEVEITL